MIKNQYEIVNRKLIIYGKDLGSITVDFDFPVRQVVYHSDNYFVLVEPDVGMILNENVFCVDDTGHIKWQVEKTTHLNVDSPYTKIILTNDQLFLYCWSGEKIEVNPATGKILSKRFTK